MQLPVYYIQDNDYGNVLHRNMSKAPGTNNTQEYAWLTVP